MKNIDSIIQFIILNKVKIELLISKNN